MALSHKYLTKKSWHPLTIRNAEKVWLAEQKDLSEKKKMLELQKKLEDERKMMELHNIKDATGKYEKKAERVDFLYRGAPEVTSEQYLEGKAYDFEKEEADLVTKGEVKLGLFASKTESSVQDMWAKVREDPLMDIMKKRQDQIEKLKDNPIKLEKLKKQLALEKESKKHKKEKKRKEKKEKKDKKDKKRKRYDSDDDVERKRSDRERRSVEGNEEKRRKTESLPSAAEASGQAVAPPPPTQSRWAPIGTRPDLIQERAELDESYRLLQQRKLEREKSRESVHKKGREELLEEMKEEAKRHRESEEKRIQRELEEDKKEEHTQRGLHDRPSFINDTNRSVYLDHNEKLEDTLHRRRHYRQRGDSSH
jgi:hypothetical protein